MPVIRIEKGATEAKFKRLNELLVKRAVDNLTNDDSEIIKLQQEKDYFNFGIKPKQAVKNA